MSQKKPNIIITMMDDQHADAFSFRGHPNLKTPHLDRLAEQGCCFTQAHHTGANWAAVCAPARAMLHTGCGYRRMNRPAHIPDDWPTLGSVLREQGYHTHGIGKWHNNASAYAKSFTSGAEIFFGGMGDPWRLGLTHFREDGDYDRFDVPYCPETGKSNKTAYHKRANADHIHVGRHVTEIFADEAVEFLENYDGDEPYVLYVAFTAPHDPCSAPKEWHDQYPPEEMQIPENFLPVHPFDNGELDIRDEQLAPFPRTEKDIQEGLSAYYAMMAHADDHIGRIHAAMRARDDADNTVIVHTGDHGIALGSHGLVGKQNVHEHSLRVPMILSGPGIPQGKLDNRLCYGMDLHPTILELAGTSNEHALDSQSLFGERRQELSFGYCKWQEAWTDGEWKMIQYTVDDQTRYQLFEIAKDPLEMNDLSENPEYAEVLERCKAENKRAQSEWVCSDNYYTY